MEFEIYEYWRGRAISTEAWQPVTYIFELAMRWLKDTTRVNDYNSFMQKGTQPNQTCSEGRSLLFLYVTATGVFLCIWGVSTRLD